MNLDTDADKLRKAQALIAAVQHALDSGIKHYSKDGKLLEKPIDIIGCLVRDGSVELISPEGFPGKMKRPT